MNELAKQENTKLAATLPVDGRNDQILQSDFKIPKILLMQGLSDFVAEGKANLGDFVRSSTVETVGGKDKPLDFIPLTFVNLWMLSENANGDGKEFEFRGYEPRTALNEKSDWDFFKDGVKWRRTKVMNLFALLPSDIDRQAAAVKKFQETGEMPDLDAAILPVLIQFKSTSFAAAKNVIDLFVKADSLARDMKVDVPVFGRTMTLGTAIEKKEKNGKTVSYYVYNVKAAAPTKKEYFEQAIRWRNVILSLGASVNEKVDESDTAAPGEAEVPF